MATYSPAQVGVKAPAGGFQQGGWYSGRQYWNGTLSDAGVIHSESNQQGAGQKVSSEVNRQSDVAQGLPLGTIDNYVAQQNAQPVQQQSFSDKAQVGKYLGNVATSAYNSSNIGVPALSSATQIADQIKSQLPTNMPEAPKTADMFNQQKQALGVDSLEGTVNSITDQLRTIEATKRQQINSEMGKAVPLNVIQGRVSEAERQQNERIDALNREKAYAVDQLNSAYKSIDLVMKFAQTDFENAKSLYDSKFKQTMDILTMAHGIEQDQISIAMKQQDVARANAQIMMNAIKDGGMDYNSLPPETMAQMNKLELQSGLPIGFFGAIKKDPKADIVSTTSADGQIQVLLRNPDGSMKLQTYGTKSAGGAKPTAAEVQRSAISDMSRTLAEAGGSDGVVSPQEWDQARQAWLRNGFDPIVFDATFASQHTNSQWGTYKVTDPKYLGGPVDALK